MEEIILNKLEREVILKVREITQQKHIGYKTDKPLKKSTYYKKGLKKGCKFTNTSGKKINISMDEEIKMVDFITEQILNYEKQRLTRYYPLIEKDVREKFSINLGRSYLCGIKRRIGENES
jgi:hypothetical protein